MSAAPDIDVLVVGAGVVGLATARAFALRGREVVVAERHRAIGHETSSRNSGVIHAGIYYPPGSVKARASRDGRAALLRFCREHGVPHALPGKLVVATDETEHERLEAVRRRAKANGVRLQWLSRAEAQAMEPALHCTAALHSPGTGIVDAHALMLALQGEAEAHGTQVALETKVERVEAGRATLADGTTLSCHRIVVCGGLAATELLPEGLRRPDGTRWTTTFAKGSYFRLERGRAPFGRLIYPVPVAGGLGIHLTLDLAGTARFGPDVEWVDRLDYTVDPTRAQAFERGVRRFWPAMLEGALVPDYAGIRPKIAGRAEADFTRLGVADHGMEGVTVLLGIESPGLTASLWLGEWAADG